MTAVAPGEAGSSTTARPASVERLAAQAAGSDETLLRRFHAVRAFARTFRPSEYHITNACNLRCRGCWFFSYDYDKRTRDQRDRAALKAFIERERTRHVNAALLIGGEPSLVPERVAAFVAGMDYVTVSTNGLRRLPGQAGRPVIAPRKHTSLRELQDDARDVRA